MMLSPPLPINESERLAALHALCLLDTPSDATLNELTALAATVFGMPITLVSLVDEGRQWFKARVGMPMQETPRSQAFCAYALERTEPLVVLDTWRDARFVGNALVTSEPYVRFYAGAPLITASGLCLGTFCVMDREPRLDFGDAQIAQLRRFASLAMLRIDTLRDIGYVDTLTQLPNRTRYLEDLGIHLAERDHGERHLSAVAIDICGATYFEHMQAAFGSSHADGFIQEKARGVIAAMAPAPVYRVDQTVFACVLEAADDASLSTQLIALQGELSCVIDYQGIPHAPQVVTGAVKLATQTSIDDTTRSLRAALSHARTQRLATTIHHPDLSATQRRAFEILASIPAALNDQHQLQLHYQPKVHTADGSCAGFEALLRWTHPRLGQVNPAQFIALAEKTALIRAITAWVMHAALAQAEQWQAAGHRFTLSFNISAVDLDNSLFADALSSALTRYRVAPALLEVEFTESAMAGDPQAVYQQLQRIRSLGLQIAIDDFGSGYSNLAYLKQIPATTLKIDQSFIRPLVSGSSDATIIAAIIKLGHQFGHRIVAEGVETQEVYELLRDWGCDEVQGYWIARPMAAREVMEWMENFSVPVKRVLN
ncbi:putative bifunctional diguanylate cyclase/phosphodiesterase [Janthinobacterium aquaticum]|uniref:putative bifunctional diguanylate cyclase/phosphodiesterase n=1 Tax=Janthinobacterium sp. FT58W TaxID=2654254 RepID=UPI001D026913|nr:GGDEF domain-containing phosphodiesterase [Janthinobacterium sp. FT58W]